MYGDIKPHKIPLNSDTVLRFPSSNLSTCFIAFHAQSVLKYKLVKLPRYVLPVKPLLKMCLVRLSLATNHASLMMCGMIGNMTIMVK